MCCRLALLTNNPEFDPAGNTAFARALDQARVTVVYVAAAARDVTAQARDRIHAGWRLLNHPLYGNFRPGHQPFRSLLLAPPHADAAGTGGLPVTDPESLQFIEEALGVYDACAGAWALPERVSPALRHDCALLDRELMRETLVRYHCV